MSQGRATGIKSHGTLAHIRYNVLGGGMQLLEFGTRLRSARRRKHLSLQTLAATIGVHRATLARWETHGDIPCGMHVARCAIELGVTILWLLALKEDPVQPVYLTPPAARLLSAFNQLGADAQDATIEMVEESLGVALMGRRTAAKP
jgi:transcriptional regulator with XRE-family HTH domain